MVTWIDQQKDPKKLASPLRQAVVRNAIRRAEVDRVMGIVVRRDITSEEGEPHMRLTAGPHPSVPYGEIHEVEVNGR